MGGFFRSGTSQAWAETPLAFYELLQADSIRASGKKRSFIMWKNYKAFNPVAPKSAPPPQRPPPPAAPAAPADDLPIIRSSADDEPAPARAAKTRPAAPVFVPDEPPVPPPLQPVAPPPRAQPKPQPVPPSEPPRREAPRAPRRTPAPSFRLLEQEGRPTRRRRSRRGLWLTLLALLLIGGGGAAAGYWYFFLRQPGAPLPFGLESLPFGLGRPKPPPVVAPPVTRPAPAPAARADTAFARIDRLSDTLSSALRNYHDRTALFARRQIDCAALARGYVAIQNLWITYAAERKERVTSFDARRTARDQGLYAAVDSVEGQFEKSHCPRP